LESSETDVAVVNLTTHNCLAPIRGAQMQLTTLGSVSGNRQVKAAVMGLVVLAAIWELASWIVAGSNQLLIMFGLSFVVLALVVHILNDWRSGVLLFLLWLLFEDLARKYLGNSMTVYFAKDFLVGIAYLSFYFAKRRKEVEFFKPPFLVPLGLFFALAVVQIFNPHSPNVLYGFLGMKLYFYYVPLMYLGYAMLSRPADLERLLKVSLIGGIVVCGLGITQSVLGVSFLTPEDTAAELYDLSHLTRYSPVTHQAVFAPSSVFVSTGRFSFYLVLLWTLAFGALGYLLLSRRLTATYGYLGLGVISAAVMVCGTRTPFVFVIGSALIMTAAFLWGAPWRWGQGHRMVKTIRRGFLFGGLGLILTVQVFPTVIGGNWAFFTETLAFSGQGSELANRAWDYPIRNLLGAFGGYWVLGNGTGMNSLGMQYVSRYLAEPLPDYSVESGYGGLDVEFGVLGPILWVVWVGVLLWQGWKVVRSLRETVYFPIAFAIWWYAVEGLVLLMYFGMQSYQDYVNNAYLWLFIGVLYRLPKLAQMPQAVPIPKHLRGVPRWRLALIGK
jgi:hypothetical protein